MPSSRKVVNTVILTFFALGFVSGRAGWRDIKKDNKYMLDALPFAIDEYNKENEGDYIVKVNSIINARMLMVSGVIFAINAEVITTPCKDFVSSSENCPTKIKRCNFRIFTVPWINKIVTTNQSCDA